MMAGSNSILPALVRKGLKLTLQMQTQRLDEAEVALRSRGRDLVQGRVQDLSVVASRVQFQGVALSGAELSARSIQLDLSQLATGRLLKEPFQVAARLQMSNQDLTTSLQSPLLSNFLGGFLEEAMPTFSASRASIKAGHIVLFDELSQRVELGLHVAENGYELLIQASCTWSNKSNAVKQHNHSAHSGDHERVAGVDMMSADTPTCLFSKRLHLGERTIISKLQLADGILDCEGIFWVTP